ncbi:nuclear apoptosis-inducing factor 1 [Lepisosteus oculatus]|uniref:nuclear apoptosis-inducing factor 1 n=1 Tax=Lepisosteus oculatus TaxID=7918 RepID=UPI0037183F16
MSSFHQGSGNRGVSVLHFKKRKSRFSYREIQVLLEEVRKNRNIVIGKFNRGVSTEVKKRTWADITARINEVSQCPREIIEVIKKWSDLKCDTKRKVAALRAGGPVTGGRARLSRELTPVESVVHQILQLASLRAPLPLEAGPYLGLGVRLGHSDRQGPARAEQEGEPDEEEEVVVGMPSSSSSSAPLAGPGNCIPPAPQALPIPVSLPLRAQAAAHKEELAEPTPVYCIASHEEPTSSPYELQYEISVDDHDVESIDSEEEHRDDSRPHFLPSGPHSAPAEDDPLLERGLRHRAGGPPAPAAPPPAAQTPLTAREKMVHNAALSVREQRTTNELLETISRSLELLSESVQQLAETQQDFVRDSLQVQRETVQVLRDFTAGALALMHDKLNGRPAP